MIAIVSDIHANLEALQATLTDIRAQGVTEILCLGDVIGYGPLPLLLDTECEDLSRVLDVDIVGPFRLTNE